MNWFQQVKQIADEIFADISDFDFFFHQLDAQMQADPKLFILDQGAITRGDSTRKRIAFVFTGDEYYEGLNSISQSLAREK